MAPPRLAGVVGDGGRKFRVCPNFPNTVRADVPSGSTMLASIESESLSRGGGIKARTQCARAGGG